ncbi:MAG TPA: hypothetical protein VEB70_07340 [Noviherbaspirillum sp.]|nr:hypothetical protein [Noviherbaspirillum sp.]
MFDVVVRGKQKEYDLDQARANAARLFKISPERADSLLSGNRVVVKRGIDEATANKYLAALRSAGLDCQLERPPAPASVAPSNTTTCVECSEPISVANAKYCPSCGTPVATSTDAKVASRNPTQDEQNEEYDDNADEQVEEDGDEQEEEDDVPANVAHHGVPRKSSKKIAVMGGCATILGLLGAAYPLFGFAGVVTAVILLVLIARDSVNAMKADLMVSEDARVITDVYQAVASFVGLSWAIGIVGLVIGLIIGVPFAGIALLLTLFARYLGNVFAALYIGVLIDVENDLVSLAGSELDNSILDIVTLKAARNMAKRDVFPLSEVEGVFCQTRRWSEKVNGSNGRSRTVQRVKYGLNLTGLFGSRNIEFSSKQKRDECRSALLTSTKSIRNAPNIDVAVDAG